MTRQKICVTVYTRYIQYICLSNRELAGLEIGVGTRLNIIISNSSQKPIYEQITTQIKSQIINGDLEEGAALPSMRSLAKELRISVITTKRAYEDLERDGFIETVAGKGSFVAQRNVEFIREEQIKTVETHLESAVDAAKLAALSLDEMQELLAIIYQEHQ